MKKYMCFMAVLSMVFLAACSGKGLKNEGTEEDVAQTEAPLEGVAQTETSSEDTEIKADLLLYGKELDFPLSEKQIQDAGLIYEDSYEDDDHVKMITSSVDDIHRGVFAVDRDGSVAGIEPMSFR